MKDSIYLVLNNWGVVRYRKSPPSLAIGEVAIKLNLTISDNWFKKVIPEGEVSVPDKAIIGDGLVIEFTALADEQLKDIDRAVKIEIAAREQ